MNKLILLSFLSFVLIAAGCSDGAVELERGAWVEGRALEEHAEVPPEGATGPPVFAVDVSKWAAEITDEEYHCMWEHGVRHVIVGTQNYRVTKQQIEEALENGMSVDAYVYLYWRYDWTERVRADLDFLADYPLGRFWLDVEDKPEGIGVAQMEEQIQEGLDACGEMPCGIYTAGWWWKPYMRNSDTFKDVPLWHAYYDLDPSLSTWEEQKFGGWERPWGKQYNETYLCGLRLDVNTMFIDAEPVTQPKSWDPVDELTAPTGLYPDDLIEVHRPFVKVLADAVPGSTRYTLEVQHYSYGRWLSFFTFQSDVAAMRISPTIRNRAYRFRILAERGVERGPWSQWAYFQYYKASELPEIEQDTTDLGPGPESEPAGSGAEPEAEEPAEEPGTTNPEPEPEPSSALTNLAPADGAQLPNGAVLLSCDPFEANDSYAFEIEFWNPPTNEWRPYYTYDGTSPERRFYPQVDRAYRWRVIAGGPNAAMSDWNRFTVGSGQFP